MKKTYIIPRLEIIATRVETPLLGDSGVNNSDQSDDGGVGAKEVIFITVDEPTYPRPFSPWGD